MMNNSKCYQCGLVNPAGDLACRRCGSVLGLPVRQSLTEQKTNYPRYLFLLPFLLLAMGFGYWSAQIKKSALASMNVDKEEWHELTMDPKVDPRDPPVETKPRDPFEGYRRGQQEDLQRIQQWNKQWERIKVPPNEYKK